MVVNTGILNLNGCLINFETVNNNLTTFHFCLTVGVNML